MIIHVPLNRKENRIETEACHIVRTIELPHHEFEAFRNNLLDDYSFIAHPADEMGTYSSGISQCLLVLCKDAEDGILIESSGCNYARYSAYLPGARTLLQMDQHPSLKNFCDQMQKLVEAYAQMAVAHQRDGVFRLYSDDLDNDIDFYNEDLFIEMLSGQPEIAYAERADDEILMTIAPEYVQHEDESVYRKLTPEEVEVMCANHVLWLHDAGGEQADFSNCLLKGVNLSCKKLLSAGFDGAKIVDTDLRSAELCLATFNGATFVNCNGTDIVAEEAAFQGAEFTTCKLDNSVFTHSDFSGARFRNCSMDGGRLQKCCLEDTTFGDMELDTVNTNGCSCNKQDWSEEPDSILSM